jgi:alkyl sulfatase BDS1-like metallo-beta-lactamase superfamily hydrolase
MRELKPAFLVPSHTRPIAGEAVVAAALTDYRDAIQYVHDQTVRFMNNGLTPDEIVERVRLPDGLAAKPYLREFYGRVDWSVRSVFDGYLGWFGGNAVDLGRLPPHEHSKKFLELAGEGRVLEQAEASLEAGDAQWALELADHLRTAGSRRAAAKGREIRAAALRALGARQLSANARNYYLTQASETLNRISIEPYDTSDTPDAMLRSFPMASFMNAMAANLDPENAQDIDTVVGFRFPDTGEEFTLHVRNSVAEVLPRFPDRPEMTVTADSMVWKGILARKRNAAAAIATGDVMVNGGKIELARFLLLFR